ncbi:hypothetical protein [Bradyrhizobium murdochi]|uniref:hypothetical protein n=1 Tax=Bradyrhizobium murdochi TaxID=1038859 RepID=UPI000A06FFFD|nr:hypothetical protein [Bradyrhizobium murdochi]
MIAKHGLLKPGSPLGVAQLFERYKRADDRTLWKLGPSGGQTLPLAAYLAQGWRLGDGPRAGPAAIAVSQATAIGNETVVAQRLTSTWETGRGAPYRLSRDVFFRLPPFSGLTKISRR